jgi:hypothetical protein
MTEPTPPVDPTPADPAPPEDPKPESLSAEQLRAALDEARRDAAKHRTRNKELEPLAKKAQELEDAQKSEQQRLTDQLAAAQKERADAQADALRMRVAVKHGVRHDDLDLLGSGSEEEIDARAQRLVAYYPKTATGQPTPGRPVEQMRPGAAPAEELSEEDATWQRLFGAPTGK